MIDIVKEIREFEGNDGDVREKGAYFRKETLISRQYFIDKVIEKFPNLEFIRILMRESVVIYDYATDREDKYYIYSVFIDKNILKFISDEVLIGSLNGEKVIDLTNLRWKWKEQVNLRNKILKVCPIIFSESEFYYVDDEHQINWNKLKFTDEIYIYPHNYKIDDYELMNSSRFILISNSSLINQTELNELCLDIIDNLSLENKKVIADAKAIYLSICEKLKRNRTLTQEERVILDQFINSEIFKIDKVNTLLVRSRKKVNFGGGNR